MESQAPTPFYHKVSLNLLTLLILCVGLYTGKAIILPLLFSILLANMLLPLTRYFIHRKFNSTIAILLPLLAFIVVSLVLIYFLSSQIMNFVDDVPTLSKRIHSVSYSFQLWFKENTSITIWKQNKYINDSLSDLADRAPGYLGTTLSSLTEFLTYITLIPIYTFLILYYRQNIKVFLISMFQRNSTTNVSDILTESTTISQKYLIGLMIETMIVFSLNSVGFLLVGVPYAFFLALMAALLNLIPYVGMLVANLLCMTITLVSSDNLSHVVWVGVILAVVQLWDNNFGMTFIVGNKVRINGLVTIIGVFMGGALCGVPGMFLAIPGLAVLKVICDKVPDLQPWGVLLGDSSVQRILPIKKVQQEISTQADESDERN
jgi:predicted PurR-regulated permease PerM